MTTFTWTPDVGANVAKKPRVRTAQFGDGYEQRVPDGINTSTEVWSLQFSFLSDADADDIMEFLDTAGGAAAFDWTPPNYGASIRAVCREWNKQFIRFNQNTITAKFERVYEP
jgi:phage-related protein